MENKKENKTSQELKLKILAYSLAVIAIFLSVHIVLAQANDNMPQKSAEERASKITDLLNKKLSLSSDQYNSVYTLYLSQAQQIDSIRENIAAGGNKEEAKAEIKNILSQTDLQMESILSTEQYQNYEYFKNQLKEKIKQRMLKKKDLDKNKQNKG